MINLVINTFKVIIPILDFSLTCKSIFFFMLYALWILKLVNLLCWTLGKSINHTFEIEFNEAKSIRKLRDEIHFSKSNYNAMDLIL